MCFQVLLVLYKGLLGWGYIIYDFQNLFFRASHGTRMLTKDELKKTYGADLHWEHFQEAKDNVKSSDGNYYTVKPVLIEMNFIKNDKST